MPYEGRTRPGPGQCFPAQAFSFISARAEGGKASTHPPSGSPVLFRQQEQTCKSGWCLRHVAEHLRWQKRYDAAIKHSAAALQVLAQDAARLSAGCVEGCAITKEPVLEGATAKRSLKARSSLCVWATTRSLWNVQASTRPPSASTKGLCTVQHREGHPKEVSSVPRVPRG